MSLAQTARRIAAPAAPDDRLGQRDFARLTAYIRATTGIKMPETKVSMLEGRLRRRVRAAGLGSLSDYCDWVFAENNLAREGVHLINAVTTNKTDFFREPRHFDYLAGTVLPAMTTAGARRIRAWSAACSTGAEPYTIAMVLDSFAADRGGPKYGILATDIDTEVLAVARRGVYAADMLRPVPAAMRDRYVRRSRRADSDEVRIAPELRAAIGFARLNLMDAAYPIGEPMDLIFCRNVLIYFDKPTQERVLSRLCERLKPGGHLFLGHSESIAGFDLPVVQVAGTVFERS